MIFKYFEMLKSMPLLIEACMGANLLRLVGIFQYI